MVLRLITALTLAGGGLFAPDGMVVAAANLTITPITWNVVGLDSNIVNVGPNTFPVGARVCNTGDAAATNVVSTFVWDSSDSYIDLRSGSSSTLSVSTLAAGGCTDFYYEVAVTRNAAAYNHTRRYHITATADTLSTVSTPMPRELYVERLISQNRNSVTDVRLDGVSVAAGGTMTLMVGNTYDIQLVGSTATNGYEQIESFINFPNTIFRINSAATTYSATDVGTPDPLAASKLYADGCEWVNDPNSPNYRSCTGTGKYGGNVTITYNVTIIGGGGTNQSLNTLIYDFSGSSYHYNGDYGSGARLVSIVSPAVVSLSKSFSPKAISPGGTSVMTIKLNNPTTETFTGVNFTDPLPSGLVVAGTPGVAYSGCGAGAFSPALAGGETSVSFANGTLSANSVCTITVTVTAASAGTYANTTGPLYVNTSVNTGNTASDTLTAASAPSCTAGVTLARWTVPSTATNPPDTTGGAPTTKASNVPTATASVNPALTASSSISSATGSNDSYSWYSHGYKTAGQYVEFVVDTRSYSGVSLTFNVNPESNGPNTLTVTYSAAGGGSGTAATYSSGGGTLTLGAWNSKTIDLSALASTAGTTTITIAGANANNDQSGSGAYFDDISFTGCSIPAPAPTIAKSFSPDPIVKGSTSTLTFTIDNTAVGNQALTGVAFTDVLPTGLSVADSSSAACTTGTLTTTAASRTIALTGGSLAAGGSCTFDVTVTGTTEGTYDNVTGFLSSTESGTSTNYATDSLTVIAPPELEKSFSATSIFTGATSTLSFTITNPNLSSALSGIGFTDTLPSGVSVATSGPAVTCGGSLSTTAPDTISFSGGSLAANTGCNFSVTVTGSTSGTKNNTTGAVTSAEGGNGNTASATLGVSDPQPLINLNKEISTDNTNWFKYVGLAVGGSVYYRFTVSNQGETTLNDVNVTDPNVNMAACAPALPASLAVGASASCVVGPVAVGSAPTPNPFVNTATVTTSTYTPSPAVTSSARYGTISLTLAKSVTQTYFTAAGNVLNYSFLVTNSGGYPLLGPVTVSDNKSTDESCPAVSTVGDNDSYLDPGESLTCTATYTVQAADVTAGFVTNTASATAGGVTSNTDSETVPLAPDLRVTKTNNTGGTIALGPSFTWTVTVINDGPGPATFADGQTIVSDPLPAGPTYGSPSAGNFSGITNWGNIACAIAAGTLSCAASGGSVTIGSGGSFTASFTVTPTSAGSFPNTATVDPGTAVAESNDGNNTGSDTVTVTAASADLSLLKGVDDSTPNAGSNVVFTLTLNNAGPSNAAGVAVTDALPAGLTFVSSNPSQGSYDSGTGVWTVGTVNNGASATLQITATVSTASGVANTAQVTASGVTDPDSTPGDGAGDDYATVSLTPVPADLSVTKSHGGNFTAGNTGTYTTTVSNAGGAGATLGTVTVSDTLPSGLTLSATPSGTGWSCSGNAGDSSFSCTRSDALGAGASYPSITATVNVSPSAAGSVTNTATVSGGGDPTPGSDDDPTTIVAQADLSLDKAVDDPTPNVGTDVTFTLTLSNAGPSVATGVTVTDLLPAGYTFVSATPSQGSYNDTTGLWTVGTVNSGASATLQITATVNASGSYANTAQVTASDASDPDSTPNNSNAGEDDQDSVTPVPVPVADLSLVKTANNPTPNVGDTIAFTLTVSNAGPSTATNVTVRDTLPAGVTFVSASAGCAHAAGVVTCTAASINNGSAAAFTITVTVTSANALTNTSQVTASDQLDPDSTPNNGVGNGEDDQYSVTTPQNIADLSLTKGVDDATPVVGTNVTFTLTLTNGGPNGATNVTVTDQLPSGYTHVSNTPSQGSYSSATGVWTVGSLANGASATLQITATVNASGTYANTAQVTAADQADPDSTPNNNAPGEDDQDGLTPVPVPVADLSLTKGVNNATPNVGSNVVFTLVVSNAGPSPATGVAVADLLPSGYTFVSAVAGQGSYASGTGVWTVGTLNSGGNATLQITATVKASGTYANTAQVTASGQTDPDSTPNNSVSSEDDQAGVTPVPVPVADLSLSKTVSNPAPLVGANVTFTVTLINSGPSTATNVAVSDPVPAGLTFVSSSPSQGSYNSGTGVWTVGTVSGGASATLSITVTVSTVGSKVNTAQVSASDQLDPDSTPANNNSAEDDQSSVGLGAIFDPPSGQKTVSPAGLPQLEWRMVWINSANVSGIAVQITDPIPAGTTYVSGSLTCEARGSSTTTTCTFDSANNRVFWQGNIGPDPGAMTEAAAANEVVITFRTSVNSGVTSVSNQASSTTDTNGDGSFSGEPTTAASSSNVAAWAGVVPVSSTLPNTGVGPAPHPDASGPNWPAFAVSMLLGFSAAVLWGVGLWNAVRRRGWKRVWGRAPGPRFTLRMAKVMLASGTALMGVALLSGVMSLGLTAPDAGGWARAFDAFVAVDLSQRLPGWANLLPAVLLGAAGVAAYGRGILRLAVRRHGGLGSTGLGIVLTLAAFVVGLIPIGPLNGQPVLALLPHDVGETIVATALAPGLNDAAEASVVEPADEAPVEASAEAAAWLDSTPIVRVAIAAASTDAPVTGVPFDGLTWRVEGLTTEAAWLDNTARPGEGNTVLAGHYTLRGGGSGPFLQLERLKAGDEVTVYTERAAYTYRVRGQRTVAPTDLSVTQPTDRSQLTLITCSDWDAAANAYRLRRVVVADLVNTEAAAGTAGN